MECQRCRCELTTQSFFDCPHQDGLPEDNARRTAVESAMSQVLLAHALHMAITSVFDFSHRKALPILQLSSMFKFPLRAPLQINTCAAGVLFQNNLNE
mmetsp:Transcript_1203/g.7909  ORF Transcript_1203/g.7909 Transcript_1203/m.7909 type:complete len:98 (+) Transcript_1203:915-1208(+)